MTAYMRKSGFPMKFKVDVDYDAGVGMNILGEKTSFNTATKIVEIGSNGANNIYIARMTFKSQPSATQLKVNYATPAVIPNGKKAKFIQFT